MIYSQAISPSGELLSNNKVIETSHQGLAGKFSGQRLLVLIPDHTRSLPLPFLFRALVDVLRDTRRLDFMIALGTHLPLEEESIHQLVGITADERRTTFRRIGLVNHEWNSPAMLTSI